MVNFDSGVCACWNLRVMQWGLPLLVRMNGAGIPLIPCSSFVFVRHIYPGHGRGHQPIATYPSIVPDDQSSSTHGLNVATNPIGLNLGQWHPCWTINVGVPRDNACQG